MHPERERRPPVSLSNKFLETEGVPTGFSIVTILRPENNSGYYTQSVVAEERRKRVLGQTFAAGDDDDDDDDDDDADVEDAGNGSSPHDPRSPSTAEPQVDSLHQSSPASTRWKITHRPQSGSRDFAIFRLRPHFLRNSVTKSQQTFTYT